MLMAAADAPAKLVQLGQSEAVGTIDDDRVGPGNVETVLDDRRRDQHVGAVFDEVEHHLFELGARADARGP